MRRMITGSLALSVGLTSVVLVVPVLSNPLAAKPHPVDTHATELRLGDLAKPATGVKAQRGLPKGVTLATDAAARLRAGAAQASAAAAAATAAKTVVVRRDSVSEFSAVGVTWKRDAAVTGVSVAVRAKAADGTWGAWSTSDAEEDPSGKTGAMVRAGAGMIWTGPADGVEVAVTSVTGSDPRDVRVELIDPGTSAADADPEAAAPAAEANAALSMPSIYSRKSWGADERKMTWTPTYAPAVKAITLHHTVNANNYSRAQVPAMLRSIYHYHSVSNGWGDVGYNVIVDRFGRLWEGRAGGIARAVGGAHAGGFNHGTSGISMLGNFSTAAVPSSTKEAIARYTAWKLSLYGVNPTGTTTLRGGQNSKYKKIVNVKVPTVFPHRTTSLTACPGNGGMNALPWIRSRAKSLMGVWANPKTVVGQAVTFDGATGIWNFRSGAKVRWGAKGDIAQPADWNGDSKSDLMVYRQRTGQWLLRGGATVRYGTGGKDIPVAGYYLRNKGVDYAVFRPSTATWWVRGQSAVRYGAPGDTPVPADYNGDGRTEMATWNPKTARWSLRGIAYYTWGKRGDIPVPADYNGDGKAEIAVFRPSTGQFIIKGVGTVLGGTPVRGDVPVPGLYNNDLKADVAIYRRTVAKFYVRGVATLTVGRSTHTPLTYR
jgi:hypothetical protein